MLLRQLRLCEYKDCVKNIQELNEHVYTVPGMHWNTLPRLCQKHTRSEWAWLYGSGYQMKCIAPLFPISTRNLHSSQSSKPFQHNLSEYPTTFESQDVSWPPRWSNILQFSCSDITLRA